MGNINAPEIHDHELTYTCRSNWECNICNKFYTFGHPFFCSSCNFNYCQSCHSYKFLLVHFHELNYTLIKNWICELCSKTFENESSYYCEECDFNCCSECYSSIDQLSKIRDEIKNVRNEYEDILEQQERTRKKAIKYYMKREKIIKNFFYASIIKNFCLPIKKQILVKKRQIEFNVDNFIHFPIKINSRKFYKQLFKDKIDELFEELKFFQEEKTVPHLNVYLLGKTGEGKNKILDTMLKFQGKKKTVKRRLFQKPTPQYEIFTSETIPWLTLYNTKGIDSFYNPIEELLATIRGEMIKSLKSDNPDEYIHVIWYCLDGENLEDSEKIVLNKLMYGYKSENIPVVIVYTQTIFKEKPNKMVEYISKNFKEKLNDIYCCSTGFYSNEEGSENKELKIIKSALKLSLYEGLASIISSKVYKIITTKASSTKKNFSNSIKEDISRLLNRTFCFRERALEYLVRNFNVIILDYLSEISDTIDLDKEDILAVKNYINGDYKILISEQFLEFKKNYLEGKASELYEKLMDLQNYTEIKFGIKMLQDRNMKFFEIKDYINEIIGKQLDCVIVKETALIAGNKFIKNLESSIFSAFNEEIEEMRKNIKIQVYIQ